MHHLPRITFRDETAGFLGGSGLSWTATLDESLMLDFARVIPAMAPSRSAPI